MSDKETIIRLIQTIEDPHVLKLIYEIIVHIMY